MKCASCASSSGPFSRPNSSSPWINSIGQRQLNSYEAIFRGCMLRFRPILMTTAAAIFGAVPLAMSFGNGGEIRRPLGLAIVGGLIVSQLMTLYTTPVLYLFMEGFVHWSRRQGPHWLGRRV